MHPIPAVHEACQIPCRANDTQPQTQRAQSQSQGLPADAPPPSLRAPNLRLHPHKIASTGGGLAQHTDGRKSGETDL